MPRLHSQPFRRFDLGGQGSGSRTGYALSSNFTLGSAGTSLGLSFQAPVTANVTAAYFFITAATTNRNLTVHLCDYGATMYRPGSSKTSYTATGGSSADKWFKATFSTGHSVTKGETYWLVIGDPAGGSGNGYSVLGRSSLGPYVGTNTTYLYTSSDGFATNGSVLSYPHCFVVVFSDGTVYGVSWTNYANHATNAVERGVKFGPMPEDLHIATFGPMGALGDTDLIYVNCYEDGVAPGGANYSRFNGGSRYTVQPADRVKQELKVDCVFLKGHTYRITFSGSGSNFAYPNYAIVEDTAAGLSDFKAALGQFCEMYMTDDDTSGGWIDYDGVDASGLYIPQIWFSVDALPFTRNHAKAARLIGAGEL